MIIKSVTIYVKKENREDFIKATLENQRNSLKEEEVISFDFFQSDENETKFLLYEVYNSEKGMSSHLETEHFKKWIETVDNFFSKPREKATYIPIG
ncbi:Autoinducer 2-degrading protein LsrG [compost metagenome]